MVWIVFSHTMGCSHPIVSACCSEAARDAWQRIDKASVDGASIQPCGCHFRTLRLCGQQAFLAKLWHFLPKEKRYSDSPNHTKQPFAAFGHAPGGWTLYYAGWSRVSTALFA